MFAVSFFIICFPSITRDGFLSLFENPLKIARNLLSEDVGIKLKSIIWKPGASIDIDKERLKVTYTTRYAIGLKPIRLQEERYYWLTKQQSNLLQLSGFYNR